MSKVAGYIAGATARKLPAKVQEKTKHHLLDTLAAIVSGSRLYPGQKAIAYIETQGGAPEALVLGSRIMTTAVNAALANGMCAHADETESRRLGSGGGHDTPLARVEHLDQRLSHQHDREQRRD